MTKADFIQRAKGFRDQRDWLFWILLGGLIVLLLWWDQLKDWAREVGPAWLPVVLAPLTLVFLIAVLVLVRLNRLRRAHRAGLTCPSCAVVLVDQCGEIVIATGNCGECGGRVFRTEPAAPGTSSRSDEAVT